MNDPTPPAAVSAGRDLDLLFAQLDRLRKLAQNPQRSAECDEVYDFSLVWGTLLAGRLPRLAYYSRMGALRPCEQARFDALQAQLRDAAPAIERLSLAKPAAAAD